MTLVITDNIVKKRDTYLELAKAFIKDAKEDFLAHVGGASFEKHIPGMGPYYISGTDTILELAE